MRKRLALIAILLFPLLAGCAYERIDIYTTDAIYSGEILSHYRNVETRDETIIMKPGARLAIRTPYGTQFLGQFEVAITEGSGMNAYLRTVSHKFDSSKGIAFRYAADGCTVRTAEGETIPLNYNAELGTQTVSLQNEADLVAISVGCRRLYEQETPLPATEYVILETLPGSTVELRAINYFDSGEE